MSAAKDEVAEAMLDAMAEIALLFSPQSFYWAPGIADRLPQILRDEGRDAYALITWEVRALSVALRIDVDPCFGFGTDAWIEYDLMRGKPQIKCTVGWSSAGSMSPGAACGLASQHLGIAQRVARAETILHQMFVRLDSVHTRTIKAAIKALGAQAETVRARVLGIKRDDERPGAEDAA